MLDRFWNDTTFRMKVVGIPALIILMITGIVYIATYKQQKNAHVAAMTWDLKIAREQYQTVAESDWYVPSGGRVDHTNWEIRTWERYISGYHNETSTSTYSCGTSKNPRTCTRTTTTRVADYSTRPVYDTKYYYYIDRWLNIQPLVTSGTVSDKVTWPNTTDFDYKNENAVGNIRLGMRYSHFQIIYRADNKDYSVDMTQDKWNRYSIGQRATLTLGFFNNVLGVD